MDTIPRSATGRPLPLLTGDEEVGSLTADVLNGVACLPENKDRVVELVAGAANRLYDTDIMRGVSSRGKGEDHCVVFAWFKTEVKTSDRLAVQRKMGL